MSQLPSGKEITATRDKSLKTVERKMNWIKKPWPKRPTDHNRECASRHKERIIYMKNLGREPEHYDEVVFLKWYRERKLGN